MADRGYPGHDGCVDQSVVDELAAYLGSRLRPVMSGGWYGRMGTLLDDTVWQSMTRLTPSGSRGSAVRWVQTALRMLGYYNGSVDGVFGPATVRAVNAFQKDHGYLERDYVSYGVARAMLEACHDRGCDLSQLP
ncbi:MAG: peptidoglycan-binding protein [Clostridia bacterium]|nr:peptidoglycan-binding protein [Clostridia bacterium]